MSTGSSTQLQQPMRFGPEQLGDSGGPTLVPDLRVLPEDEGPLKLAVVSHSLVAERQFWFFDWLGDHKLKVMKIAPDRWGTYQRPWGYPITGDTMQSFEFQEDAFRALEKFKADVIYVQEEAYCRSAAQFLRAAKRSGAKFALFVWDNLTDYADPFARNVLRDCDLVVCGNGRAEELVKPFNENTLRCIQVGVATDVFIPFGEPSKDVVFQGRMAEEKGYKILERAAKGRFSVLWPASNQGDLYSGLFIRYAEAKVLAAPSIDTPQWKEQHAGYASLEALSCGLYIATSDSEAIVEAFGNSCPGVGFAHQGDHEALRDLIEVQLGLYSGRGRNLPGREWVIQNHGYETVAGKLLPALEALL